MPIEFQTSLLPDIYNSYNSVIFSATSANNYIVAFVTDYFVRGAWWNRPYTEEHNWYGSYVASRLGVLQHSIDILQRLEVEDCIKIYNSPSYVSAYGDVLFVNAVSNHSQVLLNVSLKSPDHPFNVHDGVERLLKDTQYCLAQRTNEHCELRINTTLLWIVVGRNILQATCLIATFLTQRFHPLATLGDAIASFMSDPETLTAERGPISAADIRGKHTDSWHAVFAQRTLMPWRNERRFWATAVSWTTWALCIGL